MHGSATDESTAPGKTPTARRALTLAALGVVFGDIGTSPLYTMKEVFGGHHPIDISTGNVLGILALIFWSLIIIVSVKYVLLIMRADNKGEGGIMAMLALVLRTHPTGTRKGAVLAVLGLFGASLFYGDGIITPAISVLSAVEGLRVAEPALGTWVVPLSLAVLIALFSIQSHGTHRVGAWFGPIMSVWFLMLLVLGIINIIQAPQVLAGVNPLYAYHFFMDHQDYGFLVLGAVVLAVTGAEALYADMGHFGRSPIRNAWFYLVLPALVANYFGQGALLLEHPEAVTNPFYHQSPAWTLPILITMATLATLIASQAVITGAFSVTQQAIQLGYLPRMQIKFTSAKEMGQIYIPLINWALLLGIVALVLGFKSSSELAAAYGIAVTGTMLIDTLLAFVVVVNLWKWNRVLAVIGLCFFLSIDLAYFIANSTKILDGGWFPLLIGLLVFILLSTWKRGRELLMQGLRRESLSLEPFLNQLIAHPPQRVPGTAVFLTADPVGIPHALLHNLAHNKVLHERVVFLTVVTEPVPRVLKTERITVSDLGNGFYRAFVRYGFMDTQDIPKALIQCAARGLEFELMQTSFFLSRETIVASKIPGMAPWREHLFIQMARNAEGAMTFFKIPTNRVIELGSQVEI
ncbi:MAG TPA: potassium transporter Kup [Gammaproteobacteria bacterium]|jgi:KUP system potassium uptake protein|nr:potassium transporter Kup [Gammaproteobacteria bacterium]